MRGLRLALAAGCGCALLAIAGCGGGSSSQQNSSNSGGSGGGSTSANTVAVSVNPGPSSKFALTNGVFVSVTVCKPGTSTCVTVPDVLLDTGSSGLRLLSSKVSAIGLTNVMAGGETLANCVQYLDNSYNWGPVATADVKMSGEVASSVPIQIIAEPGYGFAGAPGGCGGTPNNTVDTLLANGILGVSFYPNDCGGACAPGTTFNPGNYYGCAGSACSVAEVAVAQQLQNPVGMFATDNNGLMLTLPSIAASGVPSTSGTLTFGIGTQSDNALGSATVLTPNSSGFFATTLNGNSTNVGFIDSGSSAMAFFDSTKTGLPACLNYTGYYCPASVATLTATNKGSNGKSSTVQFNVESADQLLNGVNDAFSDLGSPGNDATFGAYFDWGLPFFYGRTVYVAIENKSAGGTTGPYWAY